MDQTGHFHATWLDGVRLTPGEVVNRRYVVHSVLGEGGMATVYRVVDKVHPERPTALKVVGANLSTTRLGRFKAEFRIMASLRHPHVAPVYDFEPLAGSTDHFFTMAFVEGTDLRRATQGLGWRATLDLVVQVCRALSYVHSRGLVHLDLKPSNVLVDGHGDVKVLDFGLARMGRDQGWELCGTPRYMAPELTRPEGEVDGRADLYALGIMTYVLLCGRHPFSASSLPELLGMHRTQAVAFEQDDPVPGWLRDIVLRLCAKDPPERFHCANDVIDAFNRGGGLDYALETRETRESYLFASEFVGRHPELEVIDAFVRAARPQEVALLVAGQAGIGKSRLLREARHRAQLSGIAFIEVDCYEGDASEYGPVAAAVDQVIRRTEAAGGGDLVAEYAPDLAHLVPWMRQLHHSAIRPGDPDTERARWVSRIAEFLVRAERRAPYALCVNDLQWAHQGTLDVLDHVLRRVRLSRDRSGPALAVLGSYRDDEVAGRPLESFLVHLEARSAARILPLGPLNPGAIGDLLGSMLGVEDLPPRFAQRVAAETVGNPFFVEEVMRDLVEDGLVFHRDGAWAAREHIEELALPETVSAGFLRRVETLAPPERTVFETLAVVARPTTAAWLAVGAGVDRDRTDQALVTLQRRFMVRASERGELAYVPNHDRMREFLVASMSAASLRAVHLRFARNLEVACASDEERADQAAVLAWHFGLAEVAEKAVQYGRLAAGTAVGDSRFRDAAASLDLALHHVENLPEGEPTQALLGDLLLQREYVADTLGDRGAQEAAARRLLGELHHEHHPDLFLRGSLRLAELLTVLGRGDEARVLLERALALASVRGDLEGERDTLRSRAFLEWHAEAYTHAAETLERALELDRTLDDPLGEIADLGNLGNHLRHAGRPEEAEAAMRLAVDLGRAIHERTGEPVPIWSQVLVNLAGVYRQLQRFEEALSTVRLARQLHETWQTGGTPLAIAGSFEAALHWQLGDVAESVRLYREVVEISRRAGLSPELSRTLQTLGELESAQGNLDEALACFREAADVLALMLEPGREQELRELVMSIEARLLARRANGDWSHAAYPAALDGYQAALERFEACEREADAGLMRNCIARTFVDLERLDEAEACLVDAIARHEDRGDTLLLAQALSVRGSLLRRRGRVVDARLAYERAVEARRALADAQGEARMLCRLAEIACEVETDAYPAAGAALRAATACDDPELEQRCRAMLAHLQRKEEPCPDTSSSER